MKLNKNCPIYWLPSAVQEVFRLWVWNCGQLLRWRYFQKPIVVCSIFKLTKNDCTKSFLKEATSSTQGIQRDIHTNTFKHYVRKRKKDNSQIIKWNGNEANGCSLVFSRINIQDRTPWLPGTLTQQRTTWGHGAWPSSWSERVCPTTSLTKSRMAPRGPVPIEPTDSRSNPSPQELELLAFGYLMVGLLTAPKILRVHPTVELGYFVYLAKIGRILSCESATLESCPK